MKFIIWPLGCKTGNNRLVDDGMLRSCSVALIFFLFAFTPSCQGSLTTRKLNHIKNHSSWRHANHAKAAILFHFLFSLMIINETFPCVKTSLTVSKEVVVTEECRSSIVAGDNDSLGITETSFFVDESLDKVTDTIDESVVEVVDVDGETVVDKVVEVVVVVVVVVLVSFDDVVDGSDLKLLMKSSTSMFSAEASFKLLNITSGSNWTFIL